MLPWLSDNLLHRLQSAVDFPDLHGTKYRVLEKFSRGGMGTIYLAEDVQLNRKVALKVMHLADSNGEQAARMRREAQVIAQLEHPGIVPVHDVGELSDGRVFYVMKFVQGRRLDHYAATQTALPERLRVFQKICEAVAFAHARGVIHRDLKPENVMVGAFGEVLVMDWGLAKIVDSTSRIVEGGAGIEDRELKIEDGESWVVDRGSLIENRGSEISQQESTSTLRSSTLDSPPSILDHPASTKPHQTRHGTIMGTPAYMAPEQQRGEIDQIDQRTDVYALGVILKFLLLDAPIGAVNEASHSNTLPSAPLKIPKHLVAIYSQAMSPEKSGRYANALDLAQDIERFLNGLAVSSYNENAFERAWRWLKKYQLMILLIAIYLLVRILLFFWFRPWDHFFR